MNDLSLKLNCKFNFTSGYANTHPEKPNQEVETTVSTSNTSVHYSSKTKEKLVWTNEMIEFFKKKYPILKPKYLLERFKQKFNLDIEGSLTELYGKTLQVNKKTTTKNKPTMDSGGSLIKLPISRK